MAKITDFFYHVMVSIACICLSVGCVKWAVDLFKAPSES